jgi:hypothetical protein
MDSVFQWRNVITLDELNYIYRWIHSTLKYIMKEVLTAKAAQKPSVALPPPSTKPAAPATAQAPPAAPAAAPAAPAASEESENAESDIFGEELDLSGGAGKKGHGTDRYFLSQLQQNDPAIFLDTKNYARLCAANNFRQPIVVTKRKR